jgi:hypothetical protein
MRMVQNQASRAAGFISLAAAPAFALLAGSSMGAPDMLCAPGQGASAFGGMTTMYLLMSAVHLAPWLKLISQPRRTGRESYR